MIKEVRIKISDKDYLVIKTYKAQLLYEKETGKSITDLYKLTDFMMLFYYVLKANNIIDFTFEDFVTLIDQRPEAMDEFVKYITEVNSSDAETTVKKKKVDHLK